MTFPNAALPFSSSVAFAGTHQPPVGPTTLTIRQEEFKHDVVDMDIWADDVDADSYQSGAPVLITFGGPTARRAFYGYVNHAGRINNSFATSLLERNAVHITCVGASFWMKQTSARTFQSQTASQIVAQIAALFHLDALVVPDSTVWPVLHMAGMTYWQFCVMLAKKIGYTFYCSGVQLVFRPRQTNPNNLSGPVTYYDYRADPGHFPIFSPVLGANSPDGGRLALRSLSTINPRTTQVVHASTVGSPQTTVLGSSANTPLFRKMEDLTAHSQAEAQALTDGAGLSNQLYVTASAVASGNPLLSQGSLIFVANANGSQNGLWLVTSASHKLDKKSYATDLVLGRDSLGSASSISPSSIQLASAPTATLRQGVWVAV